MTVALGRSWLSDCFVGQRAVAQELDDSVKVELPVIRQKLRPSRVAQKTGGLLVKVAQQGEVIPLDLAVRNGLFDGLQQVQVVRKALVGIAMLFDELEAPILEALEQVARLAVEFIEQDVVEQRAVRGDDELQVRLTFDLINES